MSCDPRNYRAPGILPAPTAGDSLPNDEFIRVVPLVPADETGDFPDCPPAFAYQLRMRPDGATAAAGCRFKTFRASVPLKDVPRRGPLGDLQGAALRGARIRLIRDLSRSLFRPLDPLWPGLSQALRAAPEQSVDLDPKLGLAGGLAALEALCAPSDGDLGGGPDAFVMGAKARRLLVSESEKAGLAPDYRFTRLTERLTLHYHGVPVLLGDVPDSDAWALRLSGPSGVRVLYADGQELDWGITTRRDASQGIVTASYALLVPEPRSVARVTGIFGERLDVGASVGRKDDCAEHDVLLESLASTPSVTGHLYPVLMSDGGSALADERDSPRSASDFDPEHPDARTVERIRQLEKEAQEKKKRRHLTREEIIEIMRKVAGEGGTTGDWAKKWLEEWDKAQQTTPGQKKAGEGGLMTEPGMHEVLEPEELAAGKKAHRDAETRPGERDEVETPSGGRMDRYDEEHHRIREIKPDTPEEKRKGIEQLRRYKEEMDRKYPGTNHTMELTTYEVDEHGDYVWHDYVVEPDGRLRVVERPQHAAPAGGETPEHGTGEHQQEEDQQHEQDQHEQDKHEPDKQGHEKAAGEHGPRKVP